MKLSKRQLQRIIKEEKNKLAVEEIMTVGRNRRRNLNELSFKGITDFIKGATDFSAGVKTFLKKNKDWLVPTYNMIAGMANEEYGYDLPIIDTTINFARIMGMKPGDMDPHSGEEVVAVPQGMKDKDVLVAMVSIKDGSQVEYYFKNEKDEAYEVQVNKGMQKAVAEARRRRINRILRARQQRRLR